MSGQESDPGRDICDGGLICCPAWSDMRVRAAKERDEGS